MKWTVALLIVLGIIAAVCAVLLVNVLRVDFEPRGPAKPQAVVLATKNLPTMAVITSDAIELSSAGDREVPVDFCENPSQVVGKILAKPLVEGQILTQSHILTGDSAQLASALPPGMRMVSLSLSDQAISGGLLYPGCVVDVLASFTLRGANSDDSKGEAISTTLLRAVQVLAVAGESVVSEPDSKIKEKTNQSSAGRNLTVTLLVEPKQAEALQLAIENGSVSLAMRNPLDKEDADSDATVLDRGRLSKLGSLLGTTVKKEKMDGTANPLDAWTNPEPAHWEVTVIRGNKVNEEEVKLEEEK